MAACLLARSTGGTRVRWRVIFLASKSWQVFGPESMRRRLSGGKIGIAWYGCGVTIPRGAHQRLVALLTAGDLGEVFSQLSSCA
jgi:hypothetical protein